MQKLALSLPLGYRIGPPVLVLGSVSVLPRKIECPQGTQTPVPVETAMIICTNLNRHITGEMFCTAWDLALSDAAFSVVPSLDAAARARLSAAQPLRSSQGPGPPAVLVVAGRADATPHVHACPLQQHPPPGERFLLDLR